MLTAVWLRNDLRFSDNPALTAALQLGNPVVVLYFEGGKFGFTELKSKWSCRSWWKFKSIEYFKSEALKARIPFVYFKQMTSDNLKKFLKKNKIENFLYNQTNNPLEHEVENKVTGALKSVGTRVTACQANQLISWQDMKTGSGNIFQVYTPFWNKLFQNKEAISVPLPDVRVVFPKQKIDVDDYVKQSDAFVQSDYIEEVPKSEPWYLKLEQNWVPGCDEAHRLANLFLKKTIHSYSLDRDYPAVMGTSRLSPYLVSGEISMREVWHLALPHLKSQSGERFLKEIVWREFATYILFHFPHSFEKSLKIPFEKLKWDGGSKYFEAWKKGQTGYPIVDAGMRELWNTGWMHNRVRMIVASFLVKDLFVEWQKGASWFLDTLVDADAANNTMGWQWAAGCGVDAAPYFRVFNPTLQGEKFDPEGKYIRRWIPELSSLPNSYIHQPWEISLDIQSSTGVQIGKTYPKPIVDHKKSREEFLRRAANLKVPTNSEF